MFNTECGLMYHTYKIGLHMNTNNILSSVSHETHSNKFKASPCVSFPDRRGHFPHKNPKNSPKL